MAVQEIEVVRVLIGASGFLDTYVKCVAVIELKNYVLTAMQFT